MTPNPNAWAEPSVGVENAGGSEGMQISYADPQFPQPNTAFVVGKTCGRSKTMFSVGWCPNYCPGSDAANCPGVTLANTCDQDYGDRFCQVRACPACCPRGFALTTTNCGLTSVAQDNCKPSAHSLLQLLSAC